MPILHMQTDEVRQMVQFGTQSIDYCKDEISRLLARAANLESDWQSSAAVEFRTELQTILNQLLALSDEGKVLFNRAQNEVEEWEALDSAARTSLINLQSDMRIDAVLPVAGSGVFPITIPSISGIISGIVQFIGEQFRLPDWFTKKPPSPDNSVRIPGVFEGTESTPSSIASTPEEPTATESAETIALPPTISPEVTEVHHSVPVQSQTGLNRGKDETLYGCTPTSASMVMNYWHNQDGKNQTALAQDLLNENIQEKEFGNTGMTYNHIIDEFEDHGYQADLNTSPVGSDSAESKAALQDALKNGPVMTIVRLHLNTTGDVHSVVVTGYDQDNVFINDPWEGKQVTCPWDKFEDSWGSNFGKDKDGNPYPTRIFLTVKPQGK